MPVPCTPCLVIPDWHLSNKETFSRHHLDSSFRGMDAFQQKLRAGGWRAGLKGKHLLKCLKEGAFA